MEGNEEEPEDLDCHLEEVHARTGRRGSQSKEVGALL